VSGNTSAQGTGGLQFNDRTQASLDSCTITDNSGGSGGGVSSRGDGIALTQVRNSIIAANNGDDVRFVFGTINTFQSNGYNLIGTGNATSEFVERAT
jgi:hypothetical protein